MTAITNWRDFYSAFDLYNLIRNLTMPTKKSPNRNKIIESRIITQGNPSGICRINPNPTLLFFLLLMDITQIQHENRMASKSLPIHQILSDILWKYQIQHENQMAWKKFTNLSNPFWSTLKICTSFSKLKTKKITWKHAW